MATLAEVARQAHVSKTTASRVLNGLAARYRITPATVAVVEAAARTLGYRPSYAARALTRGRTDSLGMIIGNDALTHAVNQPFVASLLGGVHLAARARGRHVVLTDHAERFARESTEEPDGRFDGLIALGYVMGPDITRVDLERLATPLVLIGESAVPTRRPTVVLDPEPGIAAAVAHLAEHGHRSLAWVSLARPVHEQPGRLTPEDSQWRAKCFMQHAQARGLTCTVISTGLKGPLRAHERHAAIDDLAAALAPALSGLRDVTAVACYNDLVATAVVRCARTIGRRVPEDLAVIGFDNISADLCDPPLTTIDHRLVELGRRAADIVMDLIDDPGAAERWAGQREEVPASLIVRASTGSVLQLR